MHIGNGAAFTLKVNPDGETTWDRNNYIDKRSREERPGCHGGDLL
jgi:hypothetical protein